MSLSCSCDDYEWDVEPGIWLYCFYESSLDFEPFLAKRRKRCVSCKKLIEINSLCIRYERRRYPYTNIEANIVGCDPDMNDGPRIKISDHFHCEKCGEIFLNLTAIGYECLSPMENMDEALSEYHDLSGFTLTTAGTPK